MTIEAIFRKSRAKNLLFMDGALNAIQNQAIQPLSRHTRRREFIAETEVAFCPGCQQQYEIDLRTIVGPPDFRSWDCAPPWCASRCAAVRARRRSCWGLTPCL